MRTIEGPTRPCVLGAVLAIVFSVLVGGTVVEAQAELTVTPQEGRVGEPITVSGHRFPPDTEYTVSFQDTSVANGRTDNEGNFNAHVSVPSGLTPGPQRIIATAGSESRHGLFTVLAAAPPPSSPTAPIELPRPSSGGIDWLLVGLGALILAVGGAIGAVAMQVLYPQQSDHRQCVSRSDYTRLENKLAAVRDELDRHRSLERQIPMVRQQFDRLATQVRGHFPHLMETDLRDILSQPALDYGGLSQQVKVLVSVQSYFDAEIHKGETIRAECLALANQIKEDEPVLFDTLQHVISTANLGGLIALKPVLERIQRQVARTDISSEVRNDLTQLEKSLESIRDYSYRLIPSRLVEFAEELIRSPASARENAVREQTVRKILSFVNEYLRL